MRALGVGVGHALRHRSPIAACRVGIGSVRSLRNSTSFSHHHAMTLIASSRSHGAGGSSRYASNSSTPEKLQTTVDVLMSSAKPGVTYVLDTISAVEAMHVMVTQSVSSLVVQNESDNVVGFVTMRDLLRCVVNGIKDGDSLSDEPRGWNSPVSEIMTLSRDLVFLSPSDTLEEARALMSVSGKRHIPVLSGSTLLGVISPKDIANALHLQRPEIQEQTAKTSYVSTVIPHKGIPLRTTVKRDLDASQQLQQFALRSAVCNLPHPHKDSLGEDAFLLGPHLVGVADGVGGWWEFDIDPSTYAQALMHASRLSCSELKESFSLRPQDVLHRAWHRMQSLPEIVGSSTACLVSLHPHKSELLAANVGDSGFIILRRLEGGGSGNSREVLGTLDASVAGDGATHHVAFRSPQQLRGFNAPFQLGCAPDSPQGNPDDRFETPHDAALVRVPIKDGDVVILATDGLFDNMPESDVLGIFEAHGDRTEQELAQLLATRAQELSLDSSIDSPFAILAKDNDIMWGGGRPDDITVVVSTVVDTTKNHKPELFAAYTGPGTSAFDWE